MSAPRRLLDGIGADGLEQPADLFGPGQRRSAGAQAEAYGFSAPPSISMAAT